VCGRCVAISRLVYIPVGCAVASEPGAIQLTERGRQMAQAYADQFPCNETVDLIVSSPFVRAVDSAAPLRKRFPQADTDVWQVQEFTYLNKAVCEGTTCEQRRSMVDAFWTKATADAEHCEGGNAESFVEFHARVQTCYDRMLALFAGPEERSGSRRIGTVVIVGHELFFQTLIHLCINGPMPPDRFRSWSSSLRIPNSGSVTLLIRQDNGIVSPSVFVGAVTSPNYEQK
jgi:broad specificity phosphatase PhoE